MIGIGSSGVQIIPHIAPDVKKLYTWIRSPTWITAGFAQQYAGPGGANFECGYSCASASRPHLTNFQDSTQQKEEWAEHPIRHLNYCKAIEQELNQRFRFILKGTPEAEAAKKFSTQQMKEKLGGRTDIEEKLIPTAFGVGCRRPTVSDLTGQSPVQSFVLTAASP